MLVVLRTTTRMSQPESWLGCCSQQPSLLLLWLEAFLDVENGNGGHTAHATFEPCLESRQGLAGAGKVRHTHSLPFSHHHKKPKTPYEHLVKVLLKEPGIAKAFHRHSFWSDVCLWDADLKEDTHAKVAVLLSKKDTFLPAQKVFEYLKHSAVIPRDRFYVQMLPGHHGEFMLHPRQLDHVCRMLTFVQLQDGAAEPSG